MRLIVLAGLVSVEKTALATQLAQHFIQAGQSVLLIDNVSRVPLAEAGPVPVVRITGDLRDGLLPALAETSAQVVLLAASETIQPDDLSVLLDDVKRQHPALAVQFVALVDTRTCDCFPQFRISLESYADAVINLPAAWQTVLQALG